MKTIIKDNKIIVFLNKREITNLDFNNEDKLEDYFKKLFSKLKKYDIEINGFYNIDVYKDEFYGMILEIENEDVDYYNYFNQVDMKINVLKTGSFLYEVDYEFVDKNILNKTICYKNIDKIYLKIKENIDDITLSKILEVSNIVYGDLTEDIIKYSKRVRI